MNGWKVVVGNRSNFFYEKKFVKTVIFCCIKRIYLKEEREKQI